MLVEHWWNGAWGKMARRDVWLRSGVGDWTVEICMGGLDSGTRREWRYPHEDAARAQLRRCLDTGGTEWRSLSVRR